MEHTDHFYNCYERAKMPGLEGRYITPDHMMPFTEVIRDMGGTSEILGISVKGEPISLYTLGEGPVKVFMWSQMHGNESTTTRALCDVINYLKGYSLKSNPVLRKLTLYMIPILNPDGARAYTRVNAAETDLNRDAQERSQPESKALRAVFDRIHPDFCLNLHDQRTIFSAGGVALPATVSFLSPAFNEARDINEPRNISMKIIAGMNAVLQQIIPGQVGRYDDGFNLNCIGDTFMAQGVPTILFESGHYQEDYQRDVTRKCIATALMAALEIISEQMMHQYSKAQYMAIPENKKLFCDELIPGVEIDHNGTPEQVDLTFMFREILKDHTIIFVPVFDKAVPPGSLFAHRVLGEGQEFRYDPGKGDSLEEFALDLRKRLRQHL